MEEAKSKLRNELFNKYFENEEGIILSDLVEILSPVTEKGKELKTILQENIKGFHPFSNIYKIKCIEQDNNQYLIIRSGIFSYIVVDLKQKKALDKVSVKESFTEEIFVSSVVDEKEAKEDIENNGLDSLQFLSCKGDISEVIDFYSANKAIFDSQKFICYEINIEEAVTRLTINLLNDNIQLTFYTPDQFLYEQIFFRGDLTPSGLQDAHDKIGKERMLEMMRQVKDIRIPNNLVPSITFEEGIIPKEETKSQKNPTYIKKANQDNK